MDDVETKRLVEEITYSLKCRVYDLEHNLELFRMDFDNLKNDFESFKK